MAPLDDGSLPHFWRNNDISGFPWAGPDVFAKLNFPGFTHVSLIESNFGTLGNLEVMVTAAPPSARRWRGRPPQRFAI